MPDSEIDSCLPWGGLEGKLISSLKFRDWSSFGEDGGSWSHHHPHCTETLLSKRVHGMGFKIYGFSALSQRMENQQVCGTFLLLALSLRDLHSLLW